MPRIRRFSHEDQIVWRRNRVLQYVSKGIPTNECASLLQVSEKTIKRDISYLTEVARQNIKSHIEQRLPFEFEKALQLFEYVKRQAVDLTEHTDDDRIRLSALALARDAADSTVELLTNDEIINEALDYTEHKKLELDELVTQATQQQQKPAVGGGRRLQ